MILQTAALLLAVGFIAYALGKVTDRPGVAMIGAIVVIGVGATAMTGGIQVATGEDVTERTNTVEQRYDDIGMSTHLQTVDVSGTAPGPSGMAFDDMGSEMYVSSASGGTVEHYDTADWGLGITTHIGSLDVSAQDATPTGVVVEGSGEYLFLAGEGSDNIYRYTMSDPYNLSSAQVSGSLDVSGDSTGPRAVEFASAGSEMYVISQDSADVDKYELSTAYNLSTASLVKTFDVSAQASSPTGLAFGSDGTRMLIADSSSNSIYQYSLGTPYDVGTASYTGYSLATGGEVNQLSGVEYESNGTITLVPDQQQDNLVEYDSSGTEEVTVTDSETEYEDIQTQEGFPVGVVIISLGAVLLLGVTGEASERELETEDDDS